MPGELQPAGPNPTSTGNTHLVASIGIGSYAVVTYQHQDRGWQTAFAPVALARILNLKGARATIIVTEKARDSQPCAEMLRELAEAGLHARVESIPDGRIEQEVLAIFDKITAVVAEGAEIVLDVTFALRHLPFVYVAALTYLVGLRNVKIKGIYYGAFELRDVEKATAPIVEITPLFGLIQWYHALQTARDTGVLTNLAAQLRGDVGRLFQRQAGDIALSHAGNAAEDLAEALAAGLPIEAGFRAANLLKAIATLAPESGGAPAARLALDSLRAQLESQAIPNHPAQKRDLPLTADELARQIALAEWYAHRGDYPKAVCILREWIVNLLLLNQGAGGWLNHAAHRKPVEDCLNAFSERARQELATEAEGRLASVWDAVAALRNKLMHAGMIEAEVSVSLADVLNKVAGCRGLREVAAMAARPRPPRRVLLTSLGLSPGVVFSAVSRVAPDELLVVTSAQARERLEEALSRAGKTELKPRVIELEDPHQGFLEIARHLGGLRRSLVEAGEVVANLTGGTTAMQYAVERLAEEARRLGVPVRRIALIDRRPPEAQRADPYVLGDLVELD